ncbi:Dde1p ASCRUDRAFT_74978 [Ascoidea rubescens DSM 1968]|uniref:Uncharacterized protein n=1 Tax=Ascoidea rubescens DSM 1968 TaxID=1344418 RepID=A0A1D2VLZ4_9ASCO|nr:hypothetical protein ASCRUDRAFT_74978 [Ascoidea rubescens DSM 1968]ODV62640.1 hypothetical protein ASCRUDRAFT_74978 [Ascoidea rubescens DSM 1968]
MGTVFQTNLFDYRLMSKNNKVKINDINYRRRGIPSQNIETKLVDYKLLNDQFLAEDNSGELCIRGFGIGRPMDKEVLENAIKEGERVGGDGWMSTGLIGSWNKDGCFYEKLY